jgi:glycosyltransferase involved in cell wall biosynthesis
MNLLLVIDDYLPSSSRVGAKIMHELALGFKELGHDVTVLTPEASGQVALLNKTDLDEVAVWRFRSGPIKDISRPRRLINETLLSYRAWQAIKPELESLSIDGIIYYSPTIFFGSLVQRLKNHFSCPAYLVLRDLFPQWAIDEGMIGEKSLITRYLRFFESKNYQAADQIGLMSDKNIEVFQQLHPNYSNTEVLRNWVRVSENISDEIYWREQLGLEDKVILLYGGNIGKAQDMPNLMRLAKALQTESDAYFIFVGQGESYQNVADFIAENHLQNVTLMPSISQQEFRTLLAEVDIGLFSLAANHTAHNFPGKILGYIANQLPVLGSVNAGNDLMPTINQHQAGFVFENGDDLALVEAAKRLVQSKELRDGCGKNARQLLDSHFSVNSAVATILAALESHRN